VRKHTFLRPFIAKHRIFAKTGYKQKETLKKDVSAGVYAPDKPTLEAPRAFALSPFAGETTVVCFVFSLRLSRAWFGKRSH
jgi:hypothetical protein